MAHLVRDRVLETSTTTGTGDITLAGAVTGYRPFSDVAAVGDTCWYAIEAVDSSGNATGAYETGWGTYSAANTLNRTDVKVSSNANALVNFAAGTKYVAIATTEAGTVTLGHTLAMASGLPLR